jgi:hypothetical protein
MALVLLAACGKEMGRIPIKESGSYQQSVVLNAGKPVSLWTSLNLEYSGDIGLMYQVNVDGKTLDCTNALNPSTTIKQVRTSINGAVKVRYEGKLDCGLPERSQDGPATFGVKVLINPRPRDLVVNDLSLIVKQ